MPYIRRDECGNIIAIGKEPLDGASEQLAADTPELRSFLERMSGGNDVFQTSDLKLIRAIEDVIDLLIQKNVICITDLPPAVQSKLMERRSLRCSLDALKLFGDDEQGTI